LPSPPDLRARVEADAAELRRLFPSGPSAAQLAYRYGVSVADALPLLPLTDRAEWIGGAQKPSKDQTLSRFGSAQIEPERATDLRADHPALSEGRTIFPTTVKTPQKTERLLVSGHNNPKLGAEVRKGPWAGFPIYHLTLEERATCPRSCAQWAGCFGNTMHMARRHDHRHEDFLTLLEMELHTLAGRHPMGFAIRLHTLGDFYSVAYVAFWARMVEAIPQLHAFGFTAYSALADDAHESDIGEAVEQLSLNNWSRFAIRLSGSRGPGGSVVVTKPAPDLLMCPAQTESTTACSTCALCWSPAAFEKPIGFLKHGMKGARSKPVERDAA
jgi:hypothetical protein